jgi:hypothetical protein
MAVGERPRNGLTVSDNITVSMSYLRIGEGYEKGYVENKVG